MNFERMTIGQVRKLTEQFQRLAQENKIFRAKFPKTANEIDNSLHDILKEVGVKCH